MKQQKTYTVGTIIREGLLLRPDGKPFTSVAGVMRRIKAFGFKKSVMDLRGIMVYGISEKDLQKMNSYKYEPTK